MSDPTDSARPDAGEEPTREELQEPSTEKSPADEPKAPTTHDPEPDHEAVGIGIPGRPQVDPAIGTPEAGTASEED